MTRVAVLQMTSRIDPEANFIRIEHAAKEATQQGADMLFTPEMALLLDRDRKRAMAHIGSDGWNSFPGRLADLAKEYRVDIALGSMPVATEGGKLANRSMYFRSDGSAASTYDKIHMFDVQLEGGESWRESAAYEPGTEVVSVEDTPVGRLGLSVCYDVRFPALFEELGSRSCDAIAIPAAFTVPTGKDHWHVLLRARAIEASAFVIAAAQVGEHDDGRKTYGHSIVIDPWGEILLDMGGKDQAIGYADLNLERIAEVRSQLPSLANKRKIAT